MKQVGPELSAQNFENRLNLPDFKPRLVWRD